ncbi:MAG: Asp-tRNA(Asn)/Glu-tRNA(Gln) amidotransferase subunit GatA, partial [Burkholderiales bacterium]
MHNATIKSLSASLAARAFSSVELTRNFISRINELNRKYNCFITVDPEASLKQAAAADAMRSAGKAQPLTGIPIAQKDIFCAKGWLTTCGSKMLSNFTSPYDAHVVERLNAAGAVTLGKTNMDEFAMGSSTENSAFAVTRNPWDTERVPGGSSGGSAAAVAADQCIAALGTDTGGSIRQPAACCGIVGLKPTYGRVSRYGVIAFASSLDQVGPMTKDVTDCALMLEAVAGKDPSDSTSVEAPVPAYASKLNGGVKGLKVGMPKEYFISGIQAEVEQAVKSGIRLLEKHGVEVVEVSLPHSEYAVAVYYIIATAEASSNLARYDGVRYGPRAPESGKPEATTLEAMYLRTRGGRFGAEVKRRIMLGTYALSAGYYDAYYRKAQKVRALLHQDFVRAFKQVDA